MNTTKRREARKLYEEAIAQANRAYEGTAQSRRVSNALFKAARKAFNEAMAVSKKP